MLYTDLLPSIYQLMSLQVILTSLSLPLIFRPFLAMNVDTRTEVLSKCGSSETVCVDMRLKMLLKLPHYRYMCNLGLCTCSHRRELPILCRQLRKLWTMNVDTRRKVPSKCGSSETVCVDMRLKEQRKLPHLPIHV